MFFKLINCIKLNSLFKKKFFKLKTTKNEKKFLKILIKLHIIKYVLEKNNLSIIFINYQFNKNPFKIKNINKITNKFYITKNEIHKLTAKNQSILIISTNQGILTNKECLCKNIGGVVIASILLN